MRRPRRAPPFPDPETLAVCERASLRLRRRGGVTVGGRRRVAIEEGMDFTGFAEYVPGMDLRHLDWQIYARTGGFHVRRYAEERSGLLLILLDASGSMTVGAPPKWALARRLAAVLAYAALQELHRVQLGLIQGGALRALPITAGISFAPEAFRFLASARPAGRAGLISAVGDLHLRGERGAVVLISDFLEPQPASPLVEALARTGLRVDLCRIEAPGEFELPRRGALYDPEGRAHLSVEGLDRGAVAQGVAALLAGLRGAARARQARLIELESGARLAEAVERYYQAVARGPR
ncbi:DUF58 domain-containing protein [Myxococcota bacterium]|nr:DUF58 domain-containing protein [Myxococcota bacterium]MBU1433259.1 DUF58 domain-containing protein [Myxococcota bacterium]